MAVVFVSGFALGYISAPSAAVDDIDTTVMENDGRNESGSGKPAVATSSAAMTVPEEGVTLDASAMSDGLRTLLKSLGIDADSITLTPKMVACAEEKLGSERIIAIQNGDTPSAVEGSRLMVCYTAG